MFSKQRYLAPKDALRIVYMLVLSKHRTVLSDRTMQAIVFLEPSAAVPLSIAKSYGSSCKNLPLAAPPPSPPTTTLPLFTRRCIVQL